MQDFNSTAQAAIQDISYATVEINALQASRGAIDNERLEDLYALRGKRVILALGNEVPVEYIADITQVGLAHV